MFSTTTAVIRTACAENLGPYGMELGVVYFSEDAIFTNYNGIILAYYWTPTSYSKCGSLLKAPAALYITIYNSENQVYFGKYASSTL